MTRTSTKEPSPKGVISRVQFSIALLGIAATFVGAGLYLGRLEGRLDAITQRVVTVEDKVAETSRQLTESLDRLSAQLDVSTRSAAQSVPPANSGSAAPAVAPAVQQDPSIFVDGRLTSGLDLGVDSSERRTEWAEVANGELCMRYPNGQDWGAVFVTVGKPRDPPRPARDFSGYERLVVEARSSGGRGPVMIGLKDNGDPDDGSESKLPLQGLRESWGEFSFDLDQFRTADSKRLYVVSEFVFEGAAPVTVCVRSIRFAGGR